MEELNAKDESPQQWHRWEYYGGRIMYVFILTNAWRHISEHRVE